MATLDIFTITPYERSHRQPTLDLIFKSQQVFTHLDWQSADQWLNSKDIVVRLAWQHRELVGILATSAPLHDSVWIRIAAIHDSVPAKALLPQLWNAILEELISKHIKIAATLVIDDWISEHLPALGFSYQEDIVTLSRNTSALPAKQEDMPKIRPALLEDISRMAVIDQSAFTAPWQMSIDEIRQANRIAALCTVAIQERTIIGYQLSTLYHQSGHLARLAVLPETQGSGVGGALLHDLIQRFAKRGVRHITVNTQASNHRSQRLYTRYNFQRNGYDLPVWITNL